MTLIKLIHAWYSNIRISGKLKYKPLFSMHLDHYALESSMTIIELFKKEIGKLIGEECWGVVGGIGTGSIMSVIFLALQKLGLVSATMVYWNLITIHHKAVHGRKIIIRISALVYKNGCICQYQGC